MPVLPCPLEHQAGSIGILRRPLVGIIPLANLSVIVLPQKDVRPVVPDNLISQI